MEEEVKTLVNKIILASQDKKAKNIVTVDMSNLLGSICQYFVICEANSTTQIAAIADNIENQVKKELKERPISVEGLKESRWVGIDYGTVIVHVFIPELREFYDIEHLWEDAILEYIPDLD
ncbi:MAG: ribosome silencing factor [Dysgonomonas sp.]